MSAAKHSPPSASTKALQDLDRQHYLHPFTDYKELGQKGSRIIERADGIYIYDTDGNKILDGMSGLWCVNIGYGRKELCDAAYRQMQKLPYYNSFFQTAHPPVIELSRLLGEISQPQFGHVFFTGSGSEANDTVVRMVRRYWDLMGKPDRKVIIGRDNAYHGSTVAAAALGGMEKMHEQGGEIPDVEHIEQPYHFGCGGDLSPDEFGLKAANALEKKIQELGADRVAAFIGEPVQGAGGVIIPPENYWGEIQRICRKHDVLLVVDEVICGFGRTGHWFGSDYYGIEPDLMPFAKGVTSGYLPLGGVMVSDRVAKTLIEQGGEFFHGFTYSGHPAACAVAVENIRILRDEGIIEYVRDEAAPYFAECWQSLADHPLVGETRTLGLLGAIELVKQKSPRVLFEPKGNSGALCRDICFENGLVMRAVGDTMAISPPLIMTRSQIDEMTDIARRCLDKAYDVIADDITSG